MLCCRQLRETVYRAYLIRASDQEAESAKDNTKLINQILQLKQEKAKLLGKANFAELSLASKMATFDQAMSLLTQLRDSSHAVAVQELAQLRAFAAEKLSFKDDMMPWDVSYYAERLREAEFDFNEEELRPCVGLKGCRVCVFLMCSSGTSPSHVCWRGYSSSPTRCFSAICSRLLHLTAQAQLFGIDVVPATGIEAPKWHEDVQVEAVCNVCRMCLLLTLLQFWQINRDGSPVAYFYLDPYSRPHEKRQVH